MIEIICENCKETFCSYPSNKRRFCSSKCFYEHQRLYHKAPHLTKYNQAHNHERMTIDVRKKLRKCKLGNGEGKGYAKLLGTAEHRILAEIDLGRDLLPGEVVHHIDRNKRNNNANNLMVFKNQAEHVKWHKEHDK